MTVLLPSNLDAFYFFFCLSAVRTFIITDFNYKIHIYTLLFHLSQLFNIKIERALAKMQCLTKFDLINFSSKKKGGEERSEGNEYHTGKYHITQNK